MLSIDRGLAILLLLTQIPVSYFIIWLLKRYRRAYYQVREELSQLNSDFQENLQGLEVVQMFRREAFNSKKFSKTGVAYKKAVNGTIFYDSSISAFIEWISLAAVSLVLAVGGYLVTSGNIGLGTLTTFILYSQRLFEPLRQLAERFTQIQGGLTAVERINELLDVEIQIKDSISANHFFEDDQNVNKEFKGKIEFKNVNFFYNEGEHIIKNLSFKINPGEHVAFVGPTGSGKTTIIRLLCRLYEPQSGQIFIDDIDIKVIPIATLRNMLGVVLQDTFIFSGNVADNLKLNSNLDNLELENLCYELGLDNLIQKLPEGLNTSLRERGGNLSSGERQLLSVARVAIRNPVVLIMDEATAFMDPSTEATLQKDLDRILSKRTALVIAHRLATIESSDKILVLKGGALVEEGTHSELRLKIFDKELINLWELRNKISTVNNDIKKRINPNLQVFDLILSGLYGRYCYVQKKSERDSYKVEKIMKKMNISNLSKKNFSYLSDGEKKISLIARALIKKPDILILDEPIANLDYKSKFFVVDKINELSSLNTRIFCVTHDISMITIIYDRVLMLKDGKIIADGHQNKVINGENLNKLYGIDVEVAKNNGLWNINRLSK